MAERKGLLITFEGIDGSGKSTHLRRLALWLEAHGITPQTFAEPGGTDLGHRIRDILLKSNEPMNIHTEALLFLAARSELVATIVLPALAAGAIILLDRFTDSTIAYQGYGRGIDLNELSNLAKFAAHGLEPDLTFFLDITPEQASQRCHRPQQAQDRFESAGIDYYVKVREGYLALASAQQERIHVLDSSLSVEAVSTRIVELTSLKLINTGHMVK
jgi:dTMP kinase